MDLFRYVREDLHAEGVPLGEIARRFGTPTYVYSAATLREHYHRLARAFAELRPQICFSVKCCSNVNILRTLGALGAGMDVVSGGELARARLAGIDPAKIVFAGVGKGDDEIAQALGAFQPPGAGGSGGSGRNERGAGVGLFNIESPQEAEVIAGLAAGLGVRARAAIRLNPEVKAGGHAYISTGTAENKFGVPAREAAELIQRYHGHPGLALVGVHVHIGSSITEPGPYQEAAMRALAVMDAARARTPGWTGEVLNLGGGFGADYRTGEAPEAGVFARALVPILRERVRGGQRGGAVGGGLQVILEPGRTIAASAGVLLTRVRYVKANGGKTFVVCDAGMQTLIRPSLYDAFHFIWPVRVRAEQAPPRREERPPLPDLIPVDIVGPICESGDFLAQDRLLPRVERGDLLAVFTAGAYGMSMASHYNSHPLPAEVLVDGEAARVIRARETYEDLVRGEGP